MMSISAITGQVSIGGVPVENTPDAILAATRALMIVSRRQARLALGEDACATLDAAAADPELPWMMRESIRSAGEWHRLAPEIDELAWLLGLTDTQIDALFARAMAL